MKNVIRIIIALIAFIGCKKEDMEEPQGTYSPPTTTFFYYYYKGYALDTLGDTLNHYILRNPMHPCNSQTLVQDGFFQGRLCDMLGKMNYVLEENLQFSFLDSIDNQTPFGIASLNSDLLVANDTIEIVLQME